MNMKKKNSIKRAQSQAGLSFAERKNFRPMAKILTLLVLLMTVATGAWAQEETLLTTIVNTGDNADFKSGSKTFDNIATVTFSGEVYNFDDAWGWWSQAARTLTVTAAEGHTITRVKFYTYVNSAFDEVAPFEAILVWDNDISGSIAKVNGISIGQIGVTKIEVYGPDSELVDEVIAKITAIGTVTYTPESKALIDAARTAYNALTAAQQARVTNYSTLTGAETTYAAAEEVAFTEGVELTPTGTKNEWTLASMPDYDVELEVTYYPTHAITVKEGTLDATSWQGKAGEGNYQALPLERVYAGTALSVKYNGTKKVKSVKAKGKPATAEDKGKLIGRDGIIYDTKDEAEDAGTTAVAKIIYIGPTGHATYNHGLALALTDEGQMEWGAAMTACNNKNTSTPVTGAT